MNPQKRHKLLLQLLEHVKRKEAVPAIKLADDLLKGAESPEEILELQLIKAKCNTRLGYVDNAQAAYESAVETAAALGRADQRGSAEVALPRLLVTTHRELAQNYAKFLLDIGDLEHAEDLLEALVGLRQHRPWVSFSLVSIKRARGELAPREAKDPTDFEFDEGADGHRWLRALLRLQSGQFMDGFRDYESGLGNDNYRGVWKRPPNFLWNGDHSIKSLVVWGEQGIGDILMFAQFLRFLPSSIHDIRLEIDARLTTVLADRGEFDGRVTIREHPAEPDSAIHLPIGSLPLHVWHEALPKMPQRPFLSRGRIKKESSDGLRVGIGWRGGTDALKRRARSVPISRILRCVTSAIGDKAKMAVLQYDALQPEVEYLSKSHKNCEFMKYNSRSELDKWVSHIALCDLVVSSDNSIVHFAAAMGIPTIVILPAIPNWRWGIEGERSIWYESIRLIRDGVRLSEEQLCEEVSRLAQDEFGLRTQ